ncbi:uncharacterized protein LOC125861579 [Solanum stenotomum]|uniref:uncharacterized protein LOC125861579 n=1 Tax=Solanum stenotomum TaxID=172797 RepID=UPI0020D0331F|nr:uncharacterized protein LOC125861579 [Solanum stenotomum]
MTDPERLNRCLENYLRCMTGHKPKGWNKWLSLAEFWYHTSLKMSPFKVIYGYDPPQLSFELIAQSRVDVVDQLFKERQLMAKILKENLAKAHNMMKTSVAIRKNLKLASKFYEPYKIIKKIGPVAYKLALPPTARIHPVFHISQLKKKVGDQVNPTIDPPICSPDGQPLVEPVAILEGMYMTRMKNHKERKQGCNTSARAMGRLTARRSYPGRLSIHRHNFQTLLILEDRCHLKKSGLSQLTIKF